MTAETKKTESSANRSLALAAVFGLVFGFLLQKGGVAKFNVLIGALLLEDFTVLKVMLSAILTGMIGIHILHAKGLVKLHIKPTRWGAQIIGGLLFGIGFALLAYCPGTGAAALGQGNGDALFGFIGLMAGSYLFAQSSDLLSRTVEKWGERGKITLADVLHMKARNAVVTAAVAIFIVLILLDRLTIR